MRVTALAIVSAALLGCASARKETPESAASSGPKPGFYAVLATARGDVEMRLFKDDAPKAVEAFVVRAKAGDYDGMPFARAVPGAFLQAASRRGGGPLPLESVPGRSFDKPGRVGVAGGAEGAVGGDFFVTFLPQPWLDGKHGVMGEVTRGLDILDTASREPRLERSADGALLDAPLKPLLIGSVRFEDRP